jgi:hypothetical protein
MRNYFSTNFLWTALHTSRLAAELEAAEGDIPRFDMAHRSYVVSSVIASATFLEAASNELFQDAHDGHGLTGDGYLAPLKSGAVAQMAEVWWGTDSGSKLRPLEKWQLLLICCGKARLDRGAQPYQDAALVIQLRNTLAHFKPENVAADDEHTLETRLGRKFPHNRLMTGSGNPWWPSDALGHGCSEWAVSSSRALADYVLNEVGIQPNYRRIEASGWNGRAP